MMKKTKLGCVALVTVVFGALSAGATSITAEQASLAVRGWVAEQDTFRARLGTTVRDVQTLTMTNGIAYHSVRMAGGGTVITSGDTDDEPIVAFTESSDDLSNLDHNSPLWALLNRDSLHKRQTARYMATIVATAPLAAKAALSGTIESSRRARNAAKWKALRTAGEEISSVAALRVFAGDSWQNKPYTAKTISDVRVGPLLKTKWSQSNVGGKACWNYYTPCGLNTFNDGDAGNMVCGCVATALSQVLRYFEFPTKAVTPLTKTCFWKGQEMSMRMKGGVYDWSKMTEVPTGSTPEENRREIGKLTHDAGVALKMDYNVQGSGMSGAYSYDVRGAFLEAFGYQSATYFADRAGMIADKTDPDEFDEIRSAALQRAIYSNLDAGLPVVVGITGHEVVADGYGYSTDGLDYVHINMGWAGSADYWYLLPILSYQGGGEGVVDPEGTMYFDDATYNVFTNALASSAVLSGRILDGEDEPIASVQVTVCKHGQNQIVATATANEQGVYGVVVPAGTYDIEARSDKLVGLLENVKVSTPTTTDVNWNGLAIVPTVYNETSPTALGNSWGNDLTLGTPSVRIGGTAYYSLDKALVAVQEGDKVEILLPTILKKSMTLAASCTIFATNENAAASAITCLNEAQITVADGAAVTMTNIVFDVESTTKTVVVEDGGVLKIGGVCGLGAIETADADNLVVTSELSKPLYVYCAAAPKKGAMFAKGDLDLMTAQGCANLLMHYSNSRLGGEAVDASGEVAFRWAQGVPVPQSEAVGQLNGENYRSLADVFEDYDPSTNTEIVIFKDAVFTAYVTPATNLIMRGEGEVRPVLTAGSASGFSVSEGASLMVSNLVFTGYEDGDTEDDHGFIFVDGGALTLDDGAVLDGLTGYVYRGSGIIDLWKGTMTMKSGSAIVNCRAEGGTWYDEDGVPNETGGFGGAIYASYQADGTLNLAGGIISNCYASAFGGGVFMDDWNGESSIINVSGDLTVKGNCSKDYPYDDVCINTTRALPHFRLIDSLNGTNTVGVWISSRLKEEAEGQIDVNAEGKPFAVNALATAIAPTAFFNDTDDTLTAAIGENGMLVWATIPVDDGQCDEDLASAHVYYPDDTVKHYTNLVMAVAYMTNGTTARIEMYRGVKGSPNKKLNKYDTITKPITVPANSHLMLTAGEDGYCVRRYRSNGITIPAGTSLMVTNLVMYRYQTNPGSVANAFLIVEGGALALANGACVSNMLGNASRDAGAIAVSNGGTVTMESGSRIYHCQNTNNYDMVFETDINYGCGGGILLDNGTAYLRGGEITDCLATRGGGVYVCNTSKAYVSGDMRIAGNKWQDTNGVHRVGNVFVANQAMAYLDGVLTGEIGTRGLPWTTKDTNLVAEVSYVWTNDLAALAKSATNFIHDVTAETGVAVTNGTDALIVWCGAVKDGVYTNASDGVEYRIIGAAPSAGETLLPTLSSASDIATELAKIEDETVGEKITTLDEYNAFAAWAEDVVGGKEAVAQSDKAYVSYEFGVTNLFENAPAVEITQVENAEGGLTVSVVVKDGDDPVAVASAKVTKLFEATSDVGDWNSKLDLTVSDLTQSNADEVRFTVKPAGNPGKAFIRLKY